MARTEFQQVSFDCVKLCLSLLFKPDLSKCEVILLTAETFEFHLHSTCFHQGINTFI